MTLISSKRTTSASDTRLGILMARRPEELTKPVVRRCGCGAVFTTRKPALMRCQVCEPLADLVL